MSALVKQEIDIENDKENKTNYRNNDCTYENSNDDVSKGVSPTVWKEELESGHRNLDWKVEHQTNMWNGTERRMQQMQATELTVRT